MAESLSFPLTSKFVSVDQKNKICELIENKALKVKDVGLSPSTVYNWLDLRRKKMPLNPWGHPEKVDEISRLEMKRKIDEGVENQRPLTLAQLQEEVNRQCLLTKRRRKSSHEAEAD